MIKNILVASLLFVASSFAGANGANSSVQASAERLNDLERTTVCYDYDYDPRTCGQIWYCSYDYRSNECNYVDDDNGDPSTCRYYDGDRRGCDAQWDCEWDSRRRTCEDGHTPGPSQCSWIRDSRSCENQRDCYWDRRINACVDYR